MNWFIVDVDVFWNCAHRKRAKSVASKLWLFLGRCPILLLAAIRHARIAINPSRAAPVCSFIYPGRRTLVVIDVPVPQLPYLILHKKVSRRYEISKTVAPLRYVSTPKTEFTHNFFLYNILREGADKHQTVIVG